MEVLEKYQMIKGCADDPLQVIEKVKVFGLSSL
jgi:hypothetical protein